MKYSDPQLVLDAFAQGEFVIVMDEIKEKEGDFFVLAEYITADRINFLFNNAKGMICTSCAPEILDRLKIPLMVQYAHDNFHTNFTVSIDAAEGITTGVSAADRARSIQVLADINSTIDDIIMPGHTHPLRARDPQLRWGHTECSVTMAQRINKTPVVVICEILNEAGEKATKKELFVLAEKFDCSITSLAEMKEFLSL